MRHQLGVVGGKVRPRSRKLHLGGCDRVVHDEVDVCEPTGEEERRASVSCTAETVLKVLNPPGDAGGKEAIQ